MDTNVLIVGAGPVGLSLAGELARFGIGCRIVDSAPAPTRTSNAIAVHARTLELLDRPGLAKSFLDAGVFVESVEFHANGRVLAQLDFEDVESDYRGILDLPQSMTERLLDNYLETFGLHVERPLKLTTFQQNEMAVTATLEHGDGSVETVTAAWLAGCDGAPSTVRHMLGVPFEGVSSDEQFILADVEISWPLPHNQATVFFHRSGMLLTFPLPGGRHRVIADVSSDAEERELEPTFENVRRIFTMRVPIAAQLNDVTWLSLFHSNRRRVMEYRHGRVFLAGDSAHVHSPAGGQGMNTGMQDAYNLAWKLAMVLECGAADKLLNSYSAERTKIARGVLALSDRIRRFGTLQNPMLQRMRNFALPFLAGWDFLEHSVVNELAEIGLNYRDSPIIVNEGQFPTHTPHAGDRAPLSEIAAGVTLGSILNGPCHHLLLFAGDHASAEDISMLSAIRRDAEAAYPRAVKACIVARPELAASAPDVTVDQDGKAHEDYCPPRSCMYLIRPDLYVAYRCVPPDSAGLHRFVREFYGLIPVH